MSFQPILPSSGMVGWRFLERTFDTQNKAFQSSPLITRDTEYFATHIGEVETPADLVGDRRLLRVALGAFGLEDDLNNRYFLQKILEEGTIDPSSLANRMSDNRYTAFSAAFGFDLGVPRSKLSDFTDEIITKFKSRQFEVAVGKQNQDIRLALNARRELVEVATSDDSERTRWFQIMGNAPLRKVMETALGLPDSFSQIDVDKQAEIFAEKSKRQLGLSSLSELTQENKMNQLIERFVLRSEISTSDSLNSGSIALALLQPG